MLAFVGAEPDGMEVCHNDGDPMNNVLSNLRYDTHSSNMLDCVSHGRHLWAKKTHCQHGHKLVAHGGRRYCPECERARGRRYYHAKAS